MTYSQFRAELDVVRDNRRVIRNILRELATLPADRLSSITSGAVDYSKDRLQKTHDPDAPTINTIAQIDEDTARLQEKLQRLRDSNKYIEDLIYSADGIGGEITRLYIIEGLPMKEVASHIRLSLGHCWKLHHQTTKKLYEKDEENHT